MVGFPNKHGFFLLEMIIFWGVLFGGNPPFKKTPIWLWFEINITISQGKPDHRLWCLWYPYFGKLLEHDAAGEMKITSTCCFSWGVVYSRICYFFHDVLIDHGIFFRCI